MATYYVVVGPTQPVQPNPFEKRTFFAQGQPVQACPPSVAPRPTSGLLYPAHSWDRRSA